MHSASQELGGRGIGARWPRWRSGFSVAPVRLPAPFGQGSGTWPGIRRAGLDEPGCCLHTPRPPRRLPIGPLAMSSLPEPPLRFRGLRCCVPGSVRWKHMTQCIGFPRLLWQVATHLLALFPLRFYPLPVLEVGNWVRSGGAWNPGVGRAGSSGGSRENRLLPLPASGGRLGGFLGLWPLLPSSKPDVFHSQTSLCSVSSDPSASLSKDL